MCWSGRPRWRAERSLVVDRAGRPSVLGSTERSSELFSRRPSAHQVLRVMEVVHACTDRACWPNDLAKRSGRTLWLSTLADRAERALWSNALAERFGQPC